MPVKRRRFQPPWDIALGANSREIVSRACGGRCRPLAEFLGNSPKVLGLVLRNRGNGDLKCSAKEHVCRMLNSCDAITAGSRSARSFTAISGCGSVRPIASVHISAASTI